MKKHREYKKIEENIRDDQRREETEETRREYKRI